MSVIVIGSSSVALARYVAAGPPHSASTDAPGLYADRAVLLLVLGAMGMFTACMFYYFHVRVARLVPTWSDWCEMWRVWVLAICVTFAALHPPYVLDAYTSAWVAVCAVGLVATRCVMRRIGDPAVGAPIECVNVARVVVCTTWILLTGVVAWLELGAELAWRAHHLHRMAQLEWLQYGVTLYMLARPATRPATIAYHVLVNAAYTIDATLFLSLLYRRVFVFPLPNSAWEALGSVLGLLYHTAYGDLVLSGWERHMRALTDVVAHYVPPPPPSPPRVRDDLGELEVPEIPRRQRRTWQLVCLDDARANDPNGICTFCLAGWSSHLVRTTCCRQVFHRACLNRCVELDARCPLCRSALLE